MSETKQLETVTVNVDGVEHAFPKGMNLVDAVASIGSEIPHYCYHPKLSVVGNCRMCLIEMGMPIRDRATGEAVLDADGKPKIGWMPKPAIGCATTVAPGMHVKTNSPVVKDCRNGVMEFLLINHPLDCPICDQAGECRLQEFATDYGRGYSRYTEAKNVKPKRTRIGPRVMLDDERCILCSRCIRFSKEIANDDVLGFIDRGSYSTLTCFPGKQLENNYSLNTVDICPVGALTSTDFRFKMRVWFLKQVDSICTESSVGANTEVWSREGKIYRITPRRNDDVNDTWMTDSGRALYQLVEAENRLRQYAVDGQPASFDAAIAAALAALKGAKVGVVASAHASLEEQFLLKRIVELTGARVFMAYHQGEGDGILLSEDRSPNLRGALLTGLIDTLPTTDLSALDQALAAGEVDSLLVVHEDLSALGFSADNLAKAKVVYAGTHSNATSEAAQVVLPTLTVFERAGSFVNQNFRAQRFKSAVPGPQGIATDLTLLETLAALLAGEAPTHPAVNDVWQSLSASNPVFAGLDYNGLGNMGVALEPGPLAELPFVETRNLKYNPR